MEIVLKKGKEKKIKNFYLWIFKDEVENFEKVRKEPIQIVDVKSSTGEFLGKAFFNPKSHIVARILTRENEKINADFFKTRIKNAIERRKKLKIKSDAIRLIHAEADEIPGLIVDKFANYLAIQTRIAGIENFKHEIVKILTDTVKISGIYERNDMESRKEEGLEISSGELYGHVPRYVQIEENGLKFIVDLHYGQKTGFYLDQRDNRKKVKELIHKGDRVLDLFCYSGAFSIYCASAGAKVIGVDSDRSATDLARENAKLNQVNDKVTFLTADAFETVEQMANSGEKFDLIIIDPPAMTKTKKGAEGVKWAFHKLILNSLKMLEPGGKLVVSSCAYHISLDILQEAIRFASNDLGKRLRVIDVTFQPEDHPWILQMPETLYLKTIYLEVLR
ncbi:class I SAM-dependent rRNA methyltransferase [Candidatus Chrysopegis kryptomonas]|uniref:23S rRNA (Cytosine1962-C5)-methyltransferase n=1 Tax=Candidatus Chryseopegocella kryptomonas TaxID=1633643 RepID=A0A0P1MML4_9BACT|nr:class I SAM-dependent rRNA methyltransferase [Candidatus Chrysopegis kryptomonas]CUS96230.1 23S rRNA (cytosine1962-C5)-methyltransferase [Candidatus Chrysopegis kryptomonas]